MKQFLKRYESILRFALAAGIPKLNREEHRRYPPEISPADQDAFLRACHRGYEKAQSYVYEELCSVDKDGTLSEHQRVFRSLLLRKVIDSIIYTVMRCELHAVRRFVLHPYAPNINWEDARRNLKVANSFNDESRLTFCAVADLSTSIHLCDLVRIDHRGGARVSFLETKSGKVNLFLSEKLDQIGNVSDLSMIDELKKDLAEGHQKQAVRMLKQRYRLNQAIKFMKTDECIDPMLQVKVRAWEQPQVIHEYDDMIESVCKQADLSGVAAGTVNDCIHIFAATGPTRSRAHRAILSYMGPYLSETRRASQALRDMDVKIMREVPPEDYFKEVNPLGSNLRTCACEPFPMWGISRHHLMNILAGELLVVLLLDISGFFVLAESLGLEAAFTTRRETAKARETYGSHSVISWGDKMVRLTSNGITQTLLGGTFGRIVNNLQSPRSLLLAFKKESEAMSNQAL